MDAATSSSGDNKRFTSYKDYVNFLAEKNYSYRFLAHVFNSTWSLNFGSTKLSILDSEDGQLTKRSVSDDSLADCPTGVKTRIVILSYREVNTIDRKLLDKFAFDLDVPAFSLWEHLDYPGLDEEIPSNGRRKDLELPRLLFAASNGLSPYPRRVRDLAFKLRFLVPARSEGRSAEVGLSAWIVPSGTSHPSLPAVNIGTLELDCVR